MVGDWGEKKICFDNKCVGQLTLASTYLRPIPPSTLCGRREFFVMTCVGAAYA